MRSRWSLVVLPLCLVVTMGLACSLGPSNGPTPTPELAARALPDALDPTATIATAEPTALPPAGETVELADFIDDCFRGTGGAGDCDGLDMTNIAAGHLLDLGLVELAPPGRWIGFLVTFNDDLTGTEPFGLCLHLNLDRDPATGLDETGVPGIERGVCAEVPTGSVVTMDWSGGDFGAERESDSSLVGAYVGPELNPNQVAVWLNADLLRDPGGADPDGFLLYVGSARSITSLDYMNADLAIDQPYGIEVPDEVVAQLAE